MQKPMRVNKKQTEPPCFRHCPTERTGTCHADCKIYAGWSAEQLRRKKKNRFRKAMRIFMKERQIKTL